MNKKISLGTLISIIILVVALTFSLTFVTSLQYFNTKVNNLTARENLYKKIQELDALTRSSFYEDINEEQLLNYICTGYVAGLNDKYSAYMTAEEYNRMVQQNAGNIVGIGVNITKDSSGYLNITKVFKDSPAESSEIQVGDTIVKIDGNDTTALSLNSATNLINGEAGTKVSLVLRRSGEELTLDITRRKLTLQTVESKIIGSFGYIRITEFNNSTVGQFNDALNFIRSQNAVGVIFDVRNNLGGTLNSVCDILDTLLPEGPIVLDKNKEALFSSDKNAFNLPAVCLINENTASAAELFAAALKDYKKATLVGNTTFGKGVMQTTYQLTDGSAVRLTTGLFYPPKGVGFNETGISPDYNVVMSADNTAYLENLDETTDSQLAKAIEVVSSLSIK
jgi:carboxyl-terminal processing protease